MRALIYTFRTNPFTDEIESLFGKCFIFGKLKQDFGAFETLILKEKPKVIIGFAKATEPHSIIESKSLNRFNKTKMILQSGQKSYPLYQFDDFKFKFKINSKGTDSFCNWAMYRVSHSLVKNKICSKHGFIHCIQQDLLRVHRTLNQDLSIETEI